MIVDSTIPIVPQEKEHFDQQVRVPVSVVHHGIQLTLTRSSSKDLASTTSTNNGLNSSLEQQPLKLCRQPTCRTHHLTTVSSDSNLQNRSNSNSQRPGITFVRLNQQTPTRQLPPVQRVVVSQLRPETPDRVYAHRFTIRQLDTKDTQPTLNEAMNKQIQLTMAIFQQRITEQNMKYLHDINRLEHRLKLNQQQLTEKNDQLTKLKAFYEQWSKQQAIKNKSLLDKAITQIQRHQKSKLQNLGSLIKQELDRNLQFLMGKIRDMDMKIKIIVQSASDTDSSVDRLHKKMQDLQNTLLSQNQQKMRNLTSMLSEYIDKSTQHIEQYNRDNIQIETTMVEIDSLNSKIPTIQHKIQQMMQKVKQCQTEYMGKIGQLQQQYKKATLKIEEMEQNKKVTINQLKESTDKIKTLESALRDTKQQLRMAQNSVKQNRMVESNKEEKVKEVEASRQQLQNALRTKEATLKQLQQSLKAAQQRVKVSEHNLKCTQTRLVESETSLVNTRQSLNSTINNLRNQLQQQNKQYLMKQEMQQNNIVQLEKQCKVLEVKNKELEKSHKELQQQYKQLEQNHRQLQQTHKKQQQSQQIEQSQKQLQNTNQQQLEQSYRQLQNSHKQLQSKHKQLQNMYHKLEQSYKQLEQSYKQLQLSHQRLQTTHKQLQTTHKQLLTIHQQLLTTHQQLLTTHQQLQLTHHNLSQQYQSLRMTKTQQLRMSNISQQKRVYSSKKREEWPSQSKIFQSKLLKLPKRILQLKQMLTKYSKNMPYECQIDQTGYLKSKQEGTYLYDEEGDLFELMKEDIRKAVEHGIINI